MTKREEIISSIKNKLIESELFKTNFEWLVTPFGRNELPAVDIKDTKDEVIEEASGSSKHSLSVELTILIAENENTINVLRDKIQEVLTLMKELDESDVTIWDYIEFIENEIDIEHEETIVGLAKIELKIVYYTSKWEI